MDNTEKRSSSKDSAELCNLQKDEQKNYQTAPTSLPTDIMQSGEVYETTGIDLFGPLYLKDRGK